MWLSRFFKRRGEKVKSHDFRTTHATNHYNAHKDMKATQMLLGHSSISVTDRYVKPDEKKIRE